MAFFGVRGTVTELEVLYSYQNKVRGHTSHEIQVQGKKQKATLHNSCLLQAHHQIYSRRASPTSAHGLPVIYSQHRGSTFHMAPVACL